MDTLIKTLNKIGICVALFALAACNSSDKPETETEAPTITPTTGVFSQAEEDFYDSRLKVLIAAFQSGKLTTTYDTEIAFGTHLKPLPLKRGKTESLNENVISSISDYAQLHNSDSLMIYENGHVVFEKYFKDVTGASLINAKSLAKPLGVIATGRAIEEGYIESLDQSASDFIIEWKGTDKEAIRIRHILDMRTGLLAQNYEPENRDILNRAYLHPRHDEVIIHEYPLIHPPGTRYDYSNANSELVSILIERATDQPYQEWLSSQVLDLLNTNGGTIWLNREGGMAHSGCCVGLTSETYMKLGILVLQQGQWDGEQVLSKSFVSEMLTPTPQNKYAGMGVYLGRHFRADRGAGNPDVSFATTFHSEPYVDKDIVLFDGNGNQVVYILPARNIVIMRLGGRTLKDPKWDNAFMPNLVSNHIGSKE